MIFGAALLLFAACTQDDPLGDNGTTLPESMYPLEISSVTLDAEVSSQPWGADVPQTRVSENTDRNSSKWDGGEVITVQLGDNQTTTYKVVDAGGTLELTGDQLYWAKREDKVTAWYPANGEIRLDNQQDGNLAYVLQATTEKASFNSPVSLNFTHQLAKIRVVLTGEKAGNVEKVKIESYTSCTNTNGTVSTDGASVGEITMYKTTLSDNTDCWEANVVPGKEIKRFRVNEDDWVDLSTTFTPLKGKVHEITITVNKKIPVLQGGETITEPGDYIMRGNITSGVTLQGNGINLTLDNVTANTETPIKISGGTSTIILQGNNTLTASAAPAIWLMGENANVIISGTENSHLKVSSTDGSAAIGTNYYDGSIETWTLPCGNITIENASIEASSQFAAAAIGTGVGYQAPGTCGVITIIKSDIKATAVEYLQRGKPAVIGTGGTDGQPMSCKGINITLKDGQSKDAFLSKLTGPYTKVGAGEGLNNASNTCGPINWYNSDGSSAN